MKNSGTELAALFERDLARLAQELIAFSDDGSLWKTAPGITNSAGNLMLHLEGNLREYIGRQLGGVAYQRVRKQEFGQRDVSIDDLKMRIDELLDVIPAVIAHLTPDDLEKTYPEQVFNRAQSTFQFLIHLHGHFNYHLGQIDYLRRILTQEGALRLTQI